MGKDPDAIRREIEETRDRMDDTVEAIGYKADVPSRTKEAVTGKVDAVKTKVSDTATRAKEAVTGTASRTTDAVGDATPSRDEVKQSAKRAAGLAQENPLGLAIGAAAIGFLAGLLVPSTRVEDEKLGPVADQVKDKIKETGQEAVERGKDVAQQVAQSATETAKEETKQHGEAMADSAREHAQDVREEVRDQALPQRRRRR
jgi:gas vesicle protein